nr:lupeol synthase-like [Coffea arabica]
MQVIALYVSGEPNAILTPEHQKEIIRYVYNHQNEDGGWGLHIEGHSIVFSSILNYVTLRLLGEGPEDGEEKATARARKWILDRGGAVAISSRGKFFLSLLGVYEWEGCNPIPPEIWLLPKSFPIHPGRLMSYFRLTYMPMSYLYAKNFVGTISGLVKSLRQELYVMPYQEIDWNKARNTCAMEDLFHPFPWVQDMIWGFLYYLAKPILTRWPFSILREKALRKAMERVHYEDKSTSYDNLFLCCSDLLQVIRLIACWVEDPNSEAYKRRLARIPDFFWVAEDGLKLQLLGSQTWDVALSIQAILSSDLAEEYGPTLKKAHDYLKASQLQDDPPGNFHEMYRHISKGGWTFATQDHRWQVLDCTAEALRVVLSFAQMPPELVGERIETELHYFVPAIFFHSEFNIEKKRGVLTLGTRAIISLVDGSRTEKHKIGGTFGRQWRLQTTGPTWCYKGIACPLLIRRLEYEGQ